MDNQYGFITNPTQPQTRRANPFSKLPGGVFLPIIAGGIIVIIVVVVVLNVFFGGGGAREQFLSVLQDQQEIARVARLEPVDSASQDMRNAAINISASLASAQSKTTSFLSERGVTYKDKELELGIDQQTDEALKTAQAAGMIDSTLQTTLTTELNEYVAALQSAYDNSKNTEVRDYLNELYADAKLLLEQLTAIST